MKLDRFWAVLSVALLTVIITTDLIFGQRLFDQSLEMIPEIQAHMSDGQIEAWYYYSHIGLTIVSVLPILITYAFIEQRCRCFYYLFISCTMMGIVDFLKLAYHQPRPYWVDSEVKVIDCSGQYGDPSGHSAISIAMVLGVWLDLKDSIGRGIKYQILWQVLVLAAALVFPATIAYSRLVIGAHSLDQVLFGLMIGLWFALSVHYLIRDELMKMIQSMIDDSAHWLMFAWSIFTYTFIFLFGQALLYESMIAFAENPIEWSKNLSNQCGNQILEEAYERDSIASIGLIGLLVGAAYGMIC